MTATLVLICILLSAFATKAEPVTQIPQVGAHFPIFTYEKNENFQNAMIVYTKLTPACEIQKDEGQPVFDFYWMMDRKRFKKVHPIIKREVRQRLKIENTKDPHRFEILLSDLSEMKTDLKELRLQVTAEKNKQGQCGLKTEMQLGPSDHNAKIHLDTIYAEAKRTWNPFKRKLIAITLKGTDAANGEQIERRYPGQN